MVLRLWQEWQRLCRFSRSVNTAQSPLCGMMWSTSVALVRRRGSPGGYRTAHSRQNGSRRSCPGRRSSVHSGVEYIQRQDRDASLRRAASLGLCAAQYPPGTRAQHPGCLHGLKGFCAIGLSPPGKTKSLRRHVPQFAVHVAQALWHRHWSIFTMASLPQTLQNTTSSVVRVVGRSFFTRPFPHTGQMSHPSFAISVAPLASICNAISSLSFECPQKPTRLQVLKSYSKYKAPFFLGSIQE